MSRKQISALVGAALTAGAALGFWGTPAIDQAVADARLDELAQRVDRIVERVDKRLERLEDKIDKLLARSR